MSFANSSVRPASSAFLIESPVSLMKWEGFQSSLGSSFSVTLLLVLEQDVAGVPGIARKKHQQIIFQIIQGVGAHLQGAV